MLTPEQLRNLPMSLTDAYSELSEFILRDIARRIANGAGITDAAEYQLYRARSLGLSSKEIAAKIAETNHVSAETVEELIRTAAESSDEFDRKMLGADNGTAVPLAENKQLQKLMAAQIKETNGRCENLTNTLGFADRSADGSVCCRSLTDMYRRELDAAHMKVVTGAADYTTAVRQAVNRLAASGVRTIDYDSGTSRSVEAAVRTALMTSVSHITRRISEQNAEEFGADGWEMSAHAGARPSHAVYQGRQYTEEEYRRIILPLISEPNCRHDVYPIIMGISEPAYTEEQLQSIDPPPFTYEGRRYTAYKAQQQMRKMERAMRRQRDRCIVADAAGNKDDFTAASIKLRRQKDIYEDFCRAAGCYTEYERTIVGGYDRRLAGKTGAVTRRQRAFDRAQIRLTDAENGGKIKGSRAISSNPFASSLKHNARRAGHVDTSDQSEVNRLISRFENKYSRSDREHCLIICPNGDIYITRGDEYGVNSIDMLGDTIFGAFTTHNHPQNTTQFSFSKEDFDAAVFTHGKHIRAVDYKYEYEAVFPDREITQDDLDEAFFNAEEASREIFDNSGMDIKSYSEYIQHIIVEEACKTLGIKYVRRLKNG